jgi:translation initiation factor IF-3
MHIVNDKITSRSVRLVDKTGNQLGVLPTEQAQRMAKDAGLDLVLVSEKSVPPICKLIDYGQFKYETKKKKSQAKVAKNIIKEVKVSCKIASGDYKVRLNRAHDFLEKGYKVKVSLFFRGREIVHVDLGRDVLRNFIEDSKEYGKALSNDLKLSGRHLSIVLAPHKK